MAVIFVLVYSMGFFACAYVAGRTEMATDPNKQRGNHYCMVGAVFACIVWPLTLIFLSVASLFDSIYAAGERHAQLRK